MKHNVQWRHFFGFCVNFSHIIFFVLFLQEFESHDGGLSQDKWVFYFNDEAEKERFLKALSDIWIDFFKVSAIFFYSSYPAKKKEYFY